MQKKTILVVEDDLDICENLAAFLMSEGYGVLTAGDGRKALDILHAASTLPHAILVDLRMPRMDGFQFRQEQEKDARLAAIPVLLMTADAHVESDRVKIGRMTYVKKPIDIEALAKTLRDILEMRSHGCESQAGP